MNKNCNAEMFLVNVYQSFYLANIQFLFTVSTIITITVNLLTCCSINNTCGKHSITLTMH